MPIHAAAIILLALVAFSCSLCIADPCDEPRECPDIYSPVCGSDGVTYPSLCDLEVETCGTDVHVVHQGPCSEAAVDDPCDRPRPCPYIYSPVCGSDGVTYPSTCSMESLTCGTDVTVAYQGECVETDTADPCDPNRPCPLILMPVCGSDGVTYPSTCSMESLTCGTDVTVAYQGECVETDTADPCDPNRPCPLILMPVCGSDGVTYPNLCVFEERTCGSDVTVVRPGPCAETTTALPYERHGICPALYSPVCGSDGVTYGNICFLKSRTRGTGVTAAHPRNC